LVIRSANNLPIEKVIEAITPSMTNAKIGKVAHNAKYDYIVLARYGLVVSPLTFDTMLAEFIVDPSSRNLGLKNLCSLPPRRRDDSHRRTHRQRQEADQHGRCCR
jgi:DNA polymerase I-like protein with 3'-5' exonuclease and polymerase domains